MHRFDLGMLQSDEPSLSDMIYWEKYHHSFSGYGNNRCLMDRDTTYHVYLSHGRKRTNLKCTQQYYFLINKTFILSVVLKED